MNIGIRAAVLSGFVFVGVGIALYIWAYIVPLIIEKATYGALQSIELDYRIKPVDTPMLIADGGDAGEVLGLHSRDQRFPYTWISLNHVGQHQKVLMVPEVNSVLDHCDSIKAGISHAEVYSAVLKYLKSACRSG